MDTSKGSKSQSYQVSKVESVSISVGKVYFKIVPRLISNISYMMFQLPRNYEKIDIRVLPLSYHKKLRNKTRQVLDLSQKLNLLDVQVEEVNVFICGGEDEKSMFLIQFEPTLQIMNSEISLKIENSVVRYGTLLFNISDFRQQNLNGVFNEFSKVNNELNAELVLVSRSQTRASSTLRVDKSELFICQGLL